MLWSRKRLACSDRKHSGAVRRAVEMARVVMLVGNDGEDDVALCMFHLAHQAFLLGAHCASEASALALIAPKQFGKAMLSTSEELGRRVVRL